MCKSNTKYMTTLSFKAEEDFKRKLQILAKQKGINMSAYIKLLLTHALKEELGRVTENGMTVKEELDILWSDYFEETFGPFSSVKELMESLKKKK